MQRRAARWITRDHRYSSKVTVMLKELKWRPSAMRLIDSRLVLMYKNTYDLLPYQLQPSKHTTWLKRRCNVTTLQRRCNDVDATLFVCWLGYYLVHNALPYGQIPTLRDYCYTFFHTNSYSLERLTSPKTSHLSTVAQFSLAVSRWPLIALDITILFFII